jgi:hypothetical protein
MKNNSDEDTFSPFFVRLPQSGDGRIVKKGTFVQGTFIHFLFVQAGYPGEEQQTTLGCRGQKETGAEKTAQGEQISDKNYLKN